MALTRCPDCGRDVSTRAQTCPACGHPMKKAAPVTAVKQRRTFGCCSLIFFGLVACLAGLFFLGVNAQRHREPSLSAVFPEVRSFLAAHPEFGSPRGSRAAPDWAGGKRQRVTTDSGRDLLFYLKGGQVRTVYEDGPSGRRKVWGESGGGEDAGD